MSPIITGYHGCHIDTANDLVAGQSFRPSQNGYDWLGAGVYFWEDGPSRAADWATARFGGSGAVISATIDLGRCLNLLDIEHFSGLERAYDTVVENLQKRGLPVPKNTGKRHELDYLVVEVYCRDYALVTGHLFQTIRGCFPEGAPLFLGSRILRETHIQVAVRDVSCITNVSVVN